MTLLLGIDIGTSSAKAVLFDPDTARTLAVAGREYPIHKPAPDRAEQDPDDWWRAAVDVVRQVVSLSGRRDVDAIGLCGQMHGGVLLDHSSAPLHPAIIWPDQRSATTIAPLVEAVSEAAFTAITGTLPAAGFMGPLLLWLKQHQPDLLAKTRSVLMPKDYVRLRMTGEIATDISDAAATALFDITRKVWSDTILQKIGISADIFPPALPSAAIAGQLTEHAAAEFGLAKGIPVAAGCADQPAQGVGNGLIAPGVASVTTGSGGQVFVPLRLDESGRVPTDARLHVFNHAVPDMYYVLGAILAAGLALRWLRNLLGMERLPDAYPILSAEAAAVSPGADGLIFLPYLSGERTPHMDPLARGSFVGLNYHHGRAHLTRAVMEGVSFALRQALEISLELGGPVSTVIAAGGGSESDVWRQIQADVFGLPLQKTLLSEQTCVGAAVIAGVAAGRYASFDDARQQIVRYGPVTEPDPARQARYDELYAQFLELYPALRSNMHRLSALT